MTVHILCAFGGGYITPLMPLKNALIHKTHFFLIENQSSHWSSTFNFTSLLAFSLRTLWLLIHLLPSQTSSNSLILKKNLVRPLRVRSASQLKLDFCFYTQFKFLTIGRKNVRKRLQTSSHTLTHDTQHKLAICYEILACMQHTYPQSLHCGFWSTNLVVELTSIG